MNAGSPELDFAAIAAGWAALFGVVPEITALFSLVYLILRAAEVLRAMLGGNDHGH